MNTILKLGKQKKTGLCPVYVFVYVSGERIRFYAGFDSKTLKFSADESLLIKNIEKRITEIFTKFRLQGRTLTPELLKQEFEGNTSSDFLSFYAREMNLRRTEISASTYQKHQITLQKMRSIHKTLPFAELNFEFLQNYIAFCREQKNCTNTINSNVKNIKYYTNLAIRKGIISKNPFADYKMKKVTPVKVFLSDTEIAKLYDYFRAPYISETHHRALQPFLFSIYTGLRWSDVSQLRFSQIIENVMFVKPQKTSYIEKTVQIPLADKAKSILPKYIGQDNVFNCYSAQCENRMLKTVCEYVGIEKPVTFHAARHTFATLYLRKTKDIAGLQRLLGHSNIADTLVYTHLVIDDLKNNIKMLDT